mgnify:CR=1 FL=1
MLKAFASAISGLLCQTLVDRPGEFRRVCDRAFHIALNRHAAQVAAEFEQIWAQLQQEAARDEDPAGALKQIEDEKDEYRAIAERRVRLGLVLAEIGRANNVQVTDQELNAAILQEARNYPGQEQAVLNFYRQNPNAAAQMRAPIYEEKVCDLIFDTAKVTDTPITKEELLKEDDDL